MMGGFHIIAWFFAHFLMGRMQKIGAA
jgi:hypothetical protein